MSTQKDKKNVVLIIIVSAILLVLCVLVIMFIVVLYRRRNRYGGFYIFTSPPIPDHIASYEEGEVDIIFKKSEGGFVEVSQKEIT